MVGKLAKVADGMMQTHASKGEVSAGRLAELAGEAGADAALRDRIARATTARHALELVDQAGLAGFAAALCRRAADRCAEHVARRLRIEVVMVGFEGDVLGRAEVGQ
jgi:cobalt-precorrin-5B (C1)-methyltransferase